MIELKKRDLTNTLLALAGFNKEGKMIQGLLTEKVSLGLKRKLQKIHKEAATHYEEFQKHLAEVTKLEEGPIKQKELTDLLDEKVTLQAEKASLELIEAIETLAVYDLEVLEKIAE